MKAIKQKALLHLKQFIAEEWNIEAKTLPKSTHLEGDQKVELGTALGIISIALSLPGFLESKMVSSLTQRIQAKQNLEKLIDWSLHNLPKDNKYPCKINLTFQENSIL